MKRILTFLFLIIFAFALQGQRVLTYEGKVLRGYDANQPLNINTTCEFWHDGRDAGSFTLDGTSVDQWDDKSGNNRHVLNTNNNATRPTYDASTGRVAFTAANSTFLKVDFGSLFQPNTIFLVYKSNDANVYIANFSYAGFYSAFRIYGDFQIYAGTVLADGARNSNDNIHCGLFNGVNSKYWINGVLEASGDAGAGKCVGLYLGGNGQGTNWGDSEIMEVIGFNSDISATDRDIITAYLAGKWSITSTTTHKGYVLRY